MKKLSLILFVFVFGWSASASPSGNLNSVRNSYNDSFIFIEGGVEFAIYPNGEFDFYYNPDFRETSVVNISTPNVNISYNSGYNYDPYIQYDDYGAVIQIENVPVYYDYYGRIIQAGNIFINYNNSGRVARVGNLHVHYNRFNQISHYNGFINRHNRRYISRPWHKFYARPQTHVSVVFNSPYRAYYEPRRVTYVQYVNYYKKNNRSIKKKFYRPDHKVVSYNKGRRTTQKRDLKKVNTRSNRRVASSAKEARASRESTNRDNSKPVRQSSTRISTARTQSSGKTPTARAKRSSNSRGSAVKKKRTNSRTKVTANKSRNRNTQARAKSTTNNSRARATTKKRQTAKSRTSSQRTNKVQGRSTNRNSSVKSRSSSGSRKINSNSSSRNRSSARNVNIRG